MISIGTTVEVLKQIHTIITAIASEAILNISDLGVSVSVVDTANVAMCVMQISPEAFESFSCDETTKIGLDMASLGNTLMIFKDGPVTVTKTDRGLQFSGTGTEYGCKTLEVSTMKKEPKIPNLPLSGMVKLPSSEFRDAIKAMAVVTDKVWFKITGKNFVLCSPPGSDYLDRIFEDVIAVAPQSDADCCSLMSIDYLKDMAKALSLAKDVNLWLGLNHPLKTDCTLNGIVFSYLLAPRIEAD